MNQQPDTSTTQGKIAAMTAFEQGKRIQFRFIIDPEWEDIAYPYWHWGSCDYRIHPDDLNPPDPYQHLKDALAAGKRIRMKGENADGWQGSDAKWGFILPPDRYEIEPDPQPWTMEDVPPVCWLKSKHHPDTATFMILKIGRDFAYSLHGWCKSYEELAKNYLWSSDLKTWHPCVKGAA